MRLVFYAAMMALSAAVLAALPAQAEPPATERQETVEASSTDDARRQPMRYVYSKPTISNYSKLYWALGRQDIKDNELISYYLMINECDIHTSYRNNEFEWDKLLNTYRDYLTQESHNFPLAYEFTLPIKLGDYNFKRKGFEIQPDYILDNLRRFEFPADDYYARICHAAGGGQFAVDIPGYSRAIAVEFNRFLDVAFVPVPEEIAKVYIEEKVAQLKGNNMVEHQTHKDMMEMRDANIRLKARLFSYQKEVLSIEGKPVPLFAAIIDGYEVYADHDKQLLFYSKSFIDKDEDIEPNTDVKNPEASLETTPAETTTAPTPAAAASPAAHQPAATP